MTHEGGGSFFPPPFFCAHALPGSFRRKDFYLLKEDALRGTDLLRI